jgi:putative spermidine/putrescine transport system permease protein
MGTAVSRRPPRRFTRQAGIALTVLLAALLLSPVLLTAWGAFSGSGWYGQRSEGAAVTGPLGLFQYVLSIWGGALWRSLELVLVVVPAALLLGAPAAYAFRRLPFPGSRLLEALALLPLAMPGIALAIGLLLVGGGLPRLPLLAAGHLAYTVPLVLKTVANSLDSFDPQLEAAARTLGAGPWTRARRVVLPLLGPALVLSSLLVFAVSWGEFNVSYLLATPLVQTYPAALYSTFTNNSFPVGAAATVVFLAPVGPAMAAIQALGGEELRRGLAA